MPLVSLNLVIRSNLLYCQATGDKSMPKEAAATNTVGALSKQIAHVSHSLLEF